MLKNSFTVQAKVWLYPGKAGWHFLTIPPEITDEINFYHTFAKRGWGSLPVTITIGKTSWETSIFPDKKTNSYLLPLKAAVRAKEKIKLGETVSFTVTIRA